MRLATAIVLFLALPAWSRAQPAPEAGSEEADEQRLSEPIGGARIPALRVVLDEPGAYRTQVQIGDETFTCDAPLRESAPCLLRNVPPGRARMILDSTEGDHRVDTPVILRPGTREVMVEEGVTLDGTVGYAFITLGLLFAAPGTYLFIAADCDPTDRSCDATQTVGGVMGAIGIGFGLAGLYMITFGNPYELYGADVRRDTRPAISTEPTLEIGDPVGEPPENPAVDEGETMPGASPAPPASTTETEAEGDDDAAEEAAPPTAPVPPPSSSLGPGGALGISASGMSLTLRF